MQRESRDGLTGRVALVTGGASGIGRAIAVDLARRGARVYSVDLSAPEADANSSGTGSATIVGVSTDVTDGEAVARTMDLIQDDQGRVDILVNNAGILLSKPALAVTRDEWARVIATNQEAVFFMCQEAGRRMSRTGGGAIVNIASTSAFVSSAGQSVYEVSKAAVVSITRALALELIPHGIRVNAVAPGLIDTPMTRSLFGSEERLLGRARAEGSARPARPARGDRGGRRLSRRR